MNMEGDYSAGQRVFTRQEFYKYYDIEPVSAATDYLRGLQWLRDYYYGGKLVISWVYAYEKAPYISDILAVLRGLVSLPSVPPEPENAQMTPTEHLVYVAPGDVREDIESPEIDGFYAKVGLPGPNWADGVIVDCTNAPYRSKCRMLNVDVPLYGMTPLEFLGLFRNTQYYLVLVRW